jgi:hypothetical protein
MAKFKGATEWTPIYMLIVMVIAAILIITLAKPILGNAANVASGNLEESKSLVSGFILLLH